MQTTAHRSDADPTADEARRLAAEGRRLLDTWDAKHPQGDHAEDRHLLIEVFGVPADATQQIAA